MVGPPLLPGSEDTFMNWPKASVLSQSSLEKGKPSHAFVALKEAEVRGSARSPPSPRAWAPTDPPPGT